MKHKLPKLALLLFAVPLAVVLGATAQTGAKHLWLWISLIVCLLSFVPFLMTFESKKVNTRKTVVLAVMVAFSVIGRFVFSFLPHFKPVTAIVVIAGIYLGAELGFLCGSLSALISAFMFGPGPWTPFQMFAWGLIGLLAAALSGILQKNKPALCLFGVLSGVLYSLLLDTVATLWYDGAFSLSRYTALVLSSLPVTAVYAISNVIFLLLLAKPFGEKLLRIKIKYGV